MTTVIDAELAELVAEANRAIGAERYQSQARHRSRWEAAGRPAREDAAACIRCGGPMPPRHPASPGRSRKYCGACPAAKPGRPSIRPLSDVEVRRVLAVECPVCGEQPGHECRTIRPQHDGRPARRRHTHPHWHRLRILVAGDHERQ